MVTGWFGKGSMALAFCLSIACSGPSSLPDASFGDKKSGNSEEDDGVVSTQRNGIAKRVKQIFEANCVECHSAGASDGGIGDILDLDNLVSQDLVVPGSPKKSPVYVQMKEGKMPPSGKVGDDDLNTIEKWITGGALTGAVEENRTWVGEAEMQRLCAEDLLAQDESDRSTTRYISLVHLYDSGTTSKTLDITRQGVAKLLNSLSESKEVKGVEAINAEKTIIRVDISKFGWDEDKWATLTKPYPYLIVPKEGKALGVMQDETGSSVPVIRADWFLGTASRPPLYYAMLGSGSSLSEFEKRLELTLDKDILDKKVMRAGFDNSTVSKEHRVIERHETEHGSLWRSYEFAPSGAPVANPAANAGGDVVAGQKPPETTPAVGAPAAGAANKKNIFENPLGPLVKVRAANADLLESLIGANPLLKGALGGQLEGTDQAPFGTNAFETDGGEFIYTLPNGMLAFYVVGQTKNRIDEAPVGEGEEPIIAGMSCMSCHSRGVIAKDDMVRAKASSNTALSKSLETINALYVEPKIFNAQVTKDSSAYEKLLEKAGVDSKAKDPVFRIAKPYPLKISIEQAAAELGVKLEALEEALEGDLSDLKDKFEDDAIERKEFKANFKKMLDAVKP